MALDGIPRRSVESDPVAELMGVIRELRDRVSTLERASTLRNASISGGDGLRVLDGSGNTRVSINTTDGAVVAYDASGNATARFGPLANSNPGAYGVEVLYNGAWVQVGAGNVDWGNISNKPSSYPPSGHTHPGGDITSAVANATNATNATTATYANGSSYAFNNNVAGTTQYAVWVGNDGSYHLGRNTSSIRYKENVREHRTDPAAVLELVPVLYDRIGTYQYPTDPDTGAQLEGPAVYVPGTKGEYGLIAEQVAEHMPEIVQWYDGEIDGLRYDLLAVALLNVVKEQDARIAALEAQLPPAPPLSLPPVEANVNAPGAPDPLPAPLPYSIQPQS